MEDSDKHDQRVFVDRLIDTLRGMAIVLAKEKKV